MVKNLKNKREFLDNIKKYEGSIILIDDLPGSFFITGDEGIYHEREKCFYKTFLRSIYTLQNYKKENNRLKKENIALKEKLQAKFDLQDEQLIESLRYMVTRFALIVKVCQGKKEMLDAIEKAVKDLLIFVGGFSPEKSLKSLIKLEDIKK